MNTTESNSQGIIFIVDISGYSNFIQKIDVLNGVQIVTSLFKTIIKQNKLSFTISEIEGDAILFYKLGQPFPLHFLLSEFNDMLEEFMERIKTLRKSFPAVTDLSLKAVVHYGRIEEYKIENFKKLYGKALVDAHRLLKNNIPTDTYLMITNEYLQVLSGTSYTSDLRQGFHGCQLYDVGNLCYTYFPFHKDIHERSFSQSLNRQHLQKCN